MVHVGAAQRAAGVRNERWTDTFLRIFSLGSISNGLIHCSIFALDPWPQQITARSADFGFHYAHFSFCVSD